MYFFGYTRSAAGRHLGFMVSSLPNLALLLGSLAGAIRALLPHAP
jgi:hypothetical protein